MPLFILNTGVLAAGVLLALVSKGKLGHRFFSTWLAVSGLILVGVAFNAFEHTLIWQAPAPFNFGPVAWSSRIDLLSAIFLGILGVLTVVTALFSPGYLSHSGSHLSIANYWTCLFLFVLSMAQVMVSANVLTFLVFWELMSLTSGALVVFGSDNRRNQQAALIYIGATRIATAFLAAGFLGVYSLTGSLTFSQWNLAAAGFFLPVVLILIGLCIKAGCWPFHIWLPYAHPLAPAPVSALMSGVMIKVAIYAMMRFLLFARFDSLPVSYALILLGAVSAFWGVLFALKEQDLKRLLAYSSIENVGLILMGLGVCLYCRSHELPLMAGVALAAALFHCLNHALFKSLLFLGAGAIDVSCGTRNLSLLGGLLKNMPWTGACLLAGGAAICALPPLNGFASKWLLYQSLLGLSWTSGMAVHRAVALACVGVLSLVGGLSMACFTKALGISLLGRPRSHAAERAGECTLGMVLAQVSLAAACLLLGMCVPLVLRGFQAICAEAVGQPVNIAGAYMVPEAFLAAALITGTLGLYWVFLKPANKQVRNSATWDCGFGELSTRTEATAASFAEPIEEIFRTILQYKFTLNMTGKDRRHFPEVIRVETSMVSLLESRVYKPIIAAVEWMSRRLAVIQAGSIHLHLLYMLSTLLWLVYIGSKL